MGMFNTWKNRPKDIAVIRYKMAMETYYMQKYSCRSYVHIKIIIKSIKNVPSLSKIFHTTTPPSVS